MSSLRTLGPYVILGSLGHGAMGEVYLARDPRLRREVAIKVLPPEVGADPERLRRFEHEARAAGALDHPNVLTVHDLGSEDGRPYLVTERLEGETLREKLEHGPLPAARAVEAAIQIARGLAAAHEGGIVHRDLKPENLFVTRDGRIKILDFGLARVLARDGGGSGADSRTTITALTEAGMILGTAGYMSPQQVRGEPADARSDLFALGCVLYEMLTGRRAFHGRNAIETMNAILNSEPAAISQLRPEVSPTLERVVGHCLEKDPQKRFQSARDLTFALETIIPGPSSAPTERGVRLGSGTLALLGLMLALSSTGLFVIARRTAPHAQPVFQRLTFRRGYLNSARFAPDGGTIVYSAEWDGEPSRIFTTRLDSPASSPLALPDARLLAVSSGGEMAVLIPSRGTRVDLPQTAGTLARMPMAGGAPREIREEVEDAEWSAGGKDLAIVKNVGGKGILELPAGHSLYQGTARISGPRLSPRDDLVALIDHPSPLETGGKVVIVDRRGGIRARSRFWSDLDGVAWEPRAHEVWFTAAVGGGARALWALSVTGKERLVLRTPGRLTLHDVFRDGRALISRGSWGCISIVFDPVAQRERDLTWMDYTTVAGLSADGRTALLFDCSEAFGDRCAIGLRQTDGSPVVNLGEGVPGGISSDGHWVVARALTRPERVMVIPTRAGAPRTLDPGPVTQITWTNWIAGSHRVLFLGREEGHGERCYWQDIEGGLPHPITPENSRVPWLPSSSDGRFVIAWAEGSPFLWPIAGGGRHPITGLSPDEEVAGWTEEPGIVYVRVGGIPARFFRLELATGRRKFVRELQPADPVGLRVMTNTVLTPDGRSYAYVYARELSDLYLVSGLR